LPIVSSCLEASTNLSQIITAFVGPLAAQSFINMAGWRWAEGAFAIIQIVAMVRGLDSPQNGVDPG
jgi:hypothetical protein